MRILLTGATGFVGSYLLRRLVNGGRHRVAILHRASSATWRVTDLLGRVTRIEGELDDLGRAFPPIAAFAPEIVIHMAWAGVGSAVRNDVSQADNIRSTAALVRLAA